MKVPLNTKDIEIWRGFEELRNIANSDIEGTDKPRLPSQRTVELYDDIIRTFEIHLAPNSN